MCILHWYEMPKFVASWKEHCSGNLGKVSFGEHTLLVIRDPETQDGIRSQELQGTIAPPFLAFSSAIEIGLRNHPKFPGIKVHSASQVLSDVTVYRANSANSCKYYFIGRRI